MKGTYIFLIPVAVLAVALCFSGCVSSEPNYEELQDTPQENITLTPTPTQTPTPTRAPARIEYIGSVMDDPHEGPWDSGIVASVFYMRPWKGSITYDGIYRELSGIPGVTVIRFDPAPAHITIEAYKLDNSDSLMSVTVMDYLIPLEERKNDEPTAWDDTKNPFGSVWLDYDVYNDTKGSH